MESGPARCTLRAVPPHRPYVFLIPTVLRPSAIHGTGVFAAEPIPAGTRLWEFTDGVDWRIAPDELAAFPEPYQSRLRAWCYLDTDGRYVLCGDSAKFMNHSDTPNCDEPEGVTVANRDIAAGEELTCDYRTFDGESRDKGETFDPARS